MFVGSPYSREESSSSCGDASGWVGEISSSEERGSPIMHRSTTDRGSRLAFLGMVPERIVGISICAGTGAEKVLGESESLSSSPGLEEA